MKPSRVLAAMGVPRDIADCVIRVSFSPETDAAAVERFTAEWRRIKGRSKTQAA
jgi:cysteine sulfinate desulfinase/cysteine desulfurase-like protein